MYKKISFFIAVCLFTTATVFADVQVDETNFPDPNFRAWILQQPWGSDGVITDAQLTGSIWMINVSNQNISDLTGINFFTNLQHLWVDRNQLTSLDVSNLMNLNSLRAERNQIASINVPNSLNVLWVSNNQLTSLDLSNLTNLEALFATNNQLTSLNVSGLTNLMDLYVNDNHLTSLDVSGLTNLAYLNVSGNQLTSFDVSGLTNLISLNISENQLTSFDVSGLTSLTELLVFCNQLTSLDVTELDNLEYFGGFSQTPTLTLTGVNNNYSVEIELNNPTELAFGLIYENGVLTSTDRTIISSPFTVETGNPNFTLSGTLILNYITDGTNIPEINLNRTPVAFYTITGARLGQKPQSGIFIILYCDGSAERVMR